MVDLNGFTVESAMTMVAGTARSMGLTIKGDSPVTTVKGNSVNRELNNNEVKQWQN